MREFSKPRKVRAGRCGVWCTDASGHIRVINAVAAEMLGLTPDAAIGSRCWETMRIELPDGSLHCSPHCSLRRQAAREGVNTPYRVVVRPPARPRFEATLAAVLFSDPLGRVSGVVHLLTPLDPATITIDSMASRWWGIGESNQAVEAVLAHHTGSLSRRESEVLDLVAGGASTADIARHLFISPVTVRNHIRTILRKLAVHSRVEAAALWHVAHQVPSGSAPMDS